MKNIFLIVFCLLVSTVWAKEEKNKRIQYCTTLEEAMQQAARKHNRFFSIVMPDGPVLRY